MKTGGVIILILKIRSKYIYGADILYAGTCIVTCHGTAKEN